MNGQRSPGLRDLWVDGVCWQVPAAVCAHVRFLEGLNSNMAKAAARYADKIGELQRELAAERQERAA